MLTTVKKSDLKTLFAFSVKILYIYPRQMRNNTRWSSSLYGVELDRIAS